jgi:diguanylate cyclase
MKKTNSYQRVFLAAFILLTVFWAVLFVSHKNSGNFNYWYSFLFGLVPFFGGLIGMIKSKIWGGLQSTLGKAIFFISLGLFLWGIGENIWSYYNFFKDVPAPYPSIADIGFAPSIFFWILGTYHLSKASGALFSLKKNRWAKVLAIVGPVVLIIPTYYIQIRLARGGTLVPPGETVLKAILDIAYPLGDFLALIFAALVFALSFKYFGGFYRRAIIAVLAGLAVMYCADSVFSYTTTKGTYYNADWGDLLLSTGLFLITFGILAFVVKPKAGLSSEED